MVRRKYKEPEQFKMPGQEIIKLPNPPFTNGDFYLIPPSSNELPIGNDVTNVGVDVKEDKCNVIATFTYPPIAFVQVPPVILIYRKPNCDLPPPKQPLPIYEYETPVFVPSNCDAGGILLRFQKYLLDYEDGIFYRHGGKPNCYSRFETKVTLLKFDYSNFNNSLLPLGTIEINNTRVEYYFYVEIYLDHTWRANSSWIRSFRTSNGYFSQESIDWYKQNGWEVPDDWLTNDNSIWLYEYKSVRKCYYGNNGRLITFVDDTPSPLVYDFVPGIVFASLEFINQVREQNKNYQRVYKGATTTGTYGDKFTADESKIISDYGDRQFKYTGETDDFYGRYKFYEGSFLEINASEGFYQCKPYEMHPDDRPPYKYQPPPPPPMTCNCCPSVQQNDALLRLILKRIGSPQAVTIFDEDMDRAGDQKATKTPQTLFEGSKLNVERTEITNRLIGIENYPIKAPRSIIEDYKTIFPQDIVSLFEFAYENPEIELKSLTEFLNWQVEQESATMGQWYQIIQYDTKDANGQPKTERVELVNVAETLKEIIILLAGVNKNLTFLDDLLIRNINETIGAKTNAIRAAYIAEDIQDYLDYPTNEKSVSFPISISLPDKNLSLTENEDLGRFLKMSIGKITYQDWTGKQSLHDLLLDLLQAASTIRGAMSESGEELAHYFQFEDGVSTDE